MRFAVSRPRGRSGLSRETVITDAAVLVRAVRGPRQERPTLRFGFIPHCQSNRWFDWSSVCAELGFHHIDVSWDVERVMAEMSRCEVLICEAMHGAIVADALRIPWVPVSCYEDISAFKWRDWLSTVELPYAPTRITSLFDADRHSDAGTAPEESAQARVAAVRGVVQPLDRAAAASDRRGRASGGAAPARAGRQGRTYLSADALLQQHLDRYLRQARNAAPRLRCAGSRSGAVAERPARAAPDGCWDPDCLPQDA